MVSEFLDPWNEMADGTKDYKLLESLQEREQKRERDMARVEKKIDDALEKIKTMIKTMARQNNEIIRLITNQKGGVNSGSILGNHAGVVNEVEELKELKQTGSLSDQLKAFEMLLDKAQLNEEQALRCFLAGLEHELEMMVKMFNPKTLKKAYSLEKLQDAIKGDLVGHGQGIWIRRT